MADLGTIATLGNLTKSSRIGNPVLQPTGISWLGCRTNSLLAGYPATRLSSLMVGATRCAFGGEDFTQGNPAQPSLRMDAKGIWRFRWALPVGTHTISVNVMQAVNLNPRPSLVIKNNPGIGIPNDIESFAGPSNTWTTIGPVSVTVTSTGATWVELRCNLDTNVGAASCYFDHVVKT